MTMPGGPLLPRMGALAQPRSPRQDPDFMHALNFVLDQERDPRETVAQALISGAGGGDAYGEYIGKHQADYQRAQQQGPEAVGNFNLGFWYDQWHQSGAGGLPRELGVVHYDAAVNHGQGAARHLLRQSGGDPRRYVDLREHLYRSIPNTTPDNPPAAAGGHGEGGPADNPGWLNKRIPALRALLGEQPPNQTIGQLARAGGTR